MLVLQAVTPVNVQNKVFEGRQYVSRTFGAVVELSAQDGTKYHETVKVPVDEKTATQIRVGGHYTLGTGSFYVKEGKLAFSPKLVPVPAAGGTK